MFVLDTDHASELAYGSAAGVRLMNRLAASPEDAVITAIPVEEQMRGWLAEIRRLADRQSLIVAYGQQIRQVKLHAEWTILPWDEEAAEIFDWIKNLRIRTGTQDQKIASIILAHGATLLTRNTRDFVSIPSLKSENWLD